MAKSGKLQPETKKRGPGENIDGHTKEMIIQMLAAFKRPSEVQRELEKHYGQVVDFKTISHYRDNFPELIADRRAAMAQNFKTAIPIANKWYRILVRQELVEDLQKNLWARVPVFNKKTGDVLRDGEGNIIYERVYKGNHNAINQILDSTAKELEELLPEGEEERRRLFMRLGDTGKVALNFIVYGNNGRNGDKNK